jgi:hypothetical protein
VGPVAWEKTSPLQLLSMHNLAPPSLSLFTNVARTLCLIKGRARVLTWRESFFYFVFLLLLGVALLL